MTRMSAPLGLSTVGALAVAVAVAATPASAQTTSPGNLTTAAPTATTSGTAVKQKPRATATPEMVNEAIQRSEARAARERTSGVPQKWGSEEPFTYNPAIRRFNANQQ